MVDTATPVRTELPKARERGDMAHPNEVENPVERADLVQLLPLAVSQPAKVKTVDGGAVLVVALHCRMVEAGFERVSVAAAEAETASSWAGWGPAGWMRCLRSKYNLDGGWNEMEEAVWVLEYTRADAPGRFMLQCSLAKGMMIVCGIETGNPNNRRMVSFLLEKYVPEVVHCRQGSWAGVFEQEALLSDMFEETIIRPLTEAALRPSDFQARGTLWTERRYAIGIAAAAITSAAAAAYLATSARHAR